MRHEESAGAIIYYIEEKNPKFLILKYPTYWGFSKGIMERGEEPEQTAIRELEEETGISELELVPGFTFIQNWMYRFNGELIKKKATFFIAKVSKESAEKVKLSSEHEDFKWVSYEESLKYLKIKNNKEMLKEVYDFVIGNKPK